MGEGVILPERKEMSQLIERNVALRLGDNRSPARIPASQFDTMWRWVFTVLYQGQPWHIPAGAEVVLNGRKPDGNVFAFSGSVQDGKAVVEANVQMTAVAGSVVCELSVLSSGKVIGTANFILDVKAAPKHPNDVSSESTLPAYGEILDRIGGLESAGGGGSVAADDALSSSSVNPVQNKIVKAALDGKVDAVSGKGLSANDYTTAEKEKLAGIQAGAQVNPDLSGYALAANVHSVPNGGTAGQFLVKSSSTDYDAAWVTVPNANGVSF